MKKQLKNYTPLLPLLLLLYSSGLQAQIGEQQIISSQGEGARSVYAADLDGDGNVDVLSAFQNDGRIAWYSNDGQGNFGAQQIISTQADFAASIYATDLNGDGDMDVLSTFDKEIAWYSNDGQGNFGNEQIISTQADGASSVYAADLNGDGDVDVLSASIGDDKIAWYPNDGQGNFGNEQIISTQADFARSVYAADLDEDGDVDVLSASVRDDKIAWYPNNGQGNFGAEVVISTQADGASSVYATDLDKDGDMDVLSGSLEDDKIAWYSNDGQGNFSNEIVISTQADRVLTVYADDMDNDGDMDILSASFNDNIIAWYPNDGRGNFGAQQIISTMAIGAYSVYATDLDGDSDVDVLSASIIDNKIAWYENLLDVESPTATMESPPLHDKSDTLTITATANDDVGITDYYFAYYGLSGDPEDNTNYRQIIPTNEGDSYSVALSPDELDDDLGIFYGFVFTDGAGNDTVVLNGTYWQYEQDAFAVSSTEVGPWQELPEDTPATNRHANIIAFPFRSQPVNSVLEELGPYDESEWRLFGYNSGDNFPEYPAFDDFEPGEGYFLIKRESDEEEQISFGGAQVALNFVQDDLPLGYIINLQPGWNLIGNPFPFALDWQQVINNPYNEDISDNLSRLERLTGQDDYVQGEQLNAFEGAFVNYSGNSGTSSIELHILPALHSGANQRKHNKVEKGWELALALEQEGFYSSRAGVGMHPSAKEGYDYRDALSVPKMHSQPELLISGRDDIQAINRSVVPKQNSYRWDVQLRGIPSGTDIRMRWDGQLSSLLQEKLYLWDRLRHRLVDMAQQDSYILKAQSAEEDPAYQIYYGDPDEIYQALDIRQLSVGKPFPNPVANGFALPLSLPQQTEASVATLLLYNSQGQQVSSYKFDGLGPGYHELEMQIPQGLGKGLYFYRIQVEGEEMLQGKIVKE